MTPPRNGDSDPSTAEVRLLDAAEGCRASQAALNTTLTSIQASMARLEGQAAQVATAAQAVERIAGWATGITWRGGLLIILGLSWPAMLAAVLVVIVLGRANDLAALIPGR